MQVTVKSGTSVKTQVTGSLMNSCFYISSKAGDKVQCGAYNRYFAKPNNEKTVFVGTVIEYNSQVISGFAVFGPTVDSISNSASTTSEYAGETYSIDVGENQIYVRDMTPYSTKNLPFVVSEGQTIKFTGLFAAYRQDYTIKDNNDLITAIASLLYG